jgi:hypothetical protein
MGVKIFNKLPSKIQYLSSNKKRFHKALKKILLLGSFYTVDVLGNNGFSPLHYSLFQV